MLLWLFLLSALVGARSRSVEVSLAADWVKDPTVEIAEYLAEQSQEYFKGFIDKLCEDPGASRDRALEIASSLVPANQVTLLRTAVGMGYYMPRAQFQDSTSLRYGDPCQGAAYLVLHPGERVFCTSASMTAYIRTNHAKDTADTEYDAALETVLAKTDHILSTGATASAAYRAVLHGPYGSPSYCALYESTKAAADVLLATRFARAAASSSEATPALTHLHGFGVFLDIKNMEYKNLDDRAGSTLSDEDDEDKEIITDDSSSLSDDGDVEDEEEERMQVQKLRDLGLQVVVAVSNEPHADVLGALEDIVYNFPSHAAALSKKRVPKALRKSVADWYYKRLIQSLPQDSVYINGLHLDMSGASFNIFDVFAKLTREMALLQSLADLPLSQVARSSVLSLAISMGAADSTGFPEHTPRVDVSLGSRGVIVFMNNLEKDSMYRRWPASLQQLLMPSWSLNSVSKNMYTMILVLDPLSALGADLVVQVKEMWMQQFPIRFGFVLYPGSGEDLRRQETGVVAELTPASAATRVHVCDVFGFAKEYQSTSIALTFLLNLVEEVAQRNAAFPYTLNYVLNAYVKAVLRKDTSANKETVAKDFWAILSGEIAKDERFSTKIADSDYRNFVTASSKYIGDRNVPVNGLSLNGVVFPTVSDLRSQEVMQALHREQYVLANAVRAQKISDQTKSIFNALLEAGKSFSRYHPSLLGATAKYVDTSRELTRNLLRTLPYTFKKNHTDTNLTSTVIVIIEPREQGIRCLAGALEFFIGFERSMRLSVLLSGDTEGNACRAQDSSIAVLLRLLAEDLGAAPHEDLAAYLRLTKVLGSPAGYSCVSSTDPHCSIESLWLEGSLLIPPPISLLLESWRNAVQKCASPGAADRSLEARALGNELKAHLELSGNVVVLNGRYVELLEPWEAADFRLLAEIESNKFADKLFNILQDEESSKISSDVIVDIASFCGRYGGGDLSRVDVNEILTSSGMRSAGYIFEVEPLEDKRGTEISNTDISIYFVIDPLTTAAQRAVAVMRLVRDHLGLPYTLILVPLSQYESFPLQSFYRFVLAPSETNASAKFEALPRNHVLTVRPDVPESWNTQALFATQDIDNLRCDNVACGDDDSKLTLVTYKLKNILIAGQCFGGVGRRAAPPQGLQLVLSSNATGRVVHTDSLVMQNYGYFQLQANPGLWFLNVAEGNPAKLYIMDGSIGDHGKPLLVDSFTSAIQRTSVNKRPGLEDVTLEDLNEEEPEPTGDVSSKVWTALSNMWSGSGSSSKKASDDTIHVFSLATGHMYERLLRIMMLSVTKRTSAPVKFWLFENYLSPTFKASAAAMADEFDFEIGYVTYKWPEWLTQQTEKQRIIWGYKILFLDVLFPLHVKKIIYIDADQILRADLQELWSIDLMGKPYAYTPFCASRKETLGYQFWRSGFWASHLQGKPYHISALYVVDLETFRRNKVGDQLRAIYDQLAKDPHSLSNLDQDLPNYAQHSVPIHSLPQEWLWCESWCSDETKATAKTIDLCNNPMYKEPKLDMARRIVSGSLFNESWVELDEEIRKLEVRRGLVV